MPNRDHEDGDFLGSDMGDFDDPGTDKSSTLLVDTQEDQVLEDDLGTRPSTDRGPDALIQAPALEQTDDHNKENCPITEDDKRTSPTLSEDIFDPSQPPAHDKFIAHHGLRAIGLCNAHWSLNLVVSIAGSFSCQLNYLIIPMTTPLQQSTV